MNSSYSEKIGSSLQRLIDIKSELDNKKFTVYKLAKLIGMPHSMLVKILHPDPNKRVKNPRVDTLRKIVDFFCSEGFKVTIDDLMKGNINYDTIEITRNANNNRKQRLIPVFSVDEDTKSISSLEISSSVNPKNIIGLTYTKDINSFIRKGSIFVIDLNKIPKDNNLVALKYLKNNNTEIMKYIIKSDKIKFQTLSLDNSKIELFDSQKHKIIGVVIHIDIRT